MKVIDLHTHGIGGYDTRTADSEKILKIAGIHGTHGVSAIMPSIYPGPIEEMRASMAAVKKAIEVQCAMSDVQRSEVPLCKILGVHLEGPFLNPSQCGALDPASFLPPREYYFKEIIEEFEDIVKIITIAPELDGAAELIGTIADLGIAVNMGHSDATFAEAEKGFRKGAKGITHLFNAMRSFHHREPGIAGFAMLNPHIFVEVIADSFHLHPKVLEFIFQIKDSSRIVIVSDSVRDTCSAEFPLPKSFNKKQEEGIRNSRGILQGGAATVTDAARLLVESGFNRDSVIKCISDNPAAFLG